MSATPPRAAEALDVPAPTVRPAADRARMGSAELPVHLRRAVEESARLLHAAGAMLYLVDETGAVLRWGYDAGIRDADDLAWIRSLSFPTGVGLFGRAVAERRPQSTSDYSSDPRFVHSPLLDRFVEQMAVRSMIVAPLVGGDGPIGALGAFSHDANAFDEASGALLMALAAHAALAVDNARLIDELATSEERYRFLIERSPDLVWQVDRHEQLVFLNDRVETLLGWRPRDLIGRSALEFIHPDSVAAVQREWAASWEQPGLVRTYRFNLLHRDGHAIPVELRSVGIRVDDELVGFQGSLRDETERDRLERQLRESEARYRFLTEHSPDIITAVDAQGVLTFVSGRARGLTGWTPDEVVGKPFSELIHPDARAVMRASWRARRADPAAEQQYRLLLLHRGGGAIPVEVRSVGIVIDGEFRGSQASIRDMSDRDRLEREVRRQEAEIAASQERAKLAQELHDSVTQALFSMTLTTRSAEMLLERDPARVGEKLTELRELATDALAEMRGLIFELRPGSLDRDGLVTALRKHAAAVQGRTGISVSVEAASVDRVSLEVEESLYRIAQEALHNVVKHARATEARIGLDRSDDGLHLWVADDGVGFDPERVPSGHLGLEGIRARGERIGAEVSVRSQLNGGTRIEVRVPLEAEPTASAVAQ